MSVAPPKSNIRPQVFPGRKIGADGMTASGAGEVEHLNKMLNNINVQTKKNEQDKLPRKHNVVLSTTFSDQKMRI